MKLVESYADADVVVRGVTGTHEVVFRAGTTFIAVESGQLLVNSNWLLLPGMYAAVPGGSAASTRGTRAMLVTAKRYTGMFAVGGPVERVGRLRYIDGCSDTGLIQPPRLGDPCLNFLHFPPGVSQTPHTHPSIRVGIVVRGAGVCTADDETLMLAGDIFMIAAGSVHAFRTDGAPMDIVAFHPDSVVGPTDEHHAMLAATCALNP